MHPLALDLLQQERVCVISVTLPDGSPHAAVVHYSQRLDPPELFIQTAHTLKTDAIQKQGGTAKAAVVVGFDEEAFVTLQLRGDVRIVADPQELEAIYKMYYAKQPQAEKYKGPHTIFLAFTPAWWRYSDLKTRPPMVIEEE